MREWKNFGQLILPVIIGIMTMIFSYAEDGPGRIELYGTWITTDENGAFQDADTIRFYREDDLPTGISRCQLVQWDFSLRRFYQSRLSNCLSLGSIGIKSRRKVRFRKMAYGRVLEIREKRHPAEKYKVLSLDSTSLVLLRVQPPNDKLYRLVDLLMRRMADTSESATNETSFLDLSNAAAPEGQIWVRGNTFRKPLLVINGIPMSDPQVLKAFDLAEMISLTHLKEENLASFCRPITDIILIQLPPEKFDRELQRLRRKRRKEW